jgi:hypothetical protein
MTTVTFFHYKRDRHLLNLYNHRRRVADPHHFHANPVFTFIADTDLPFTLQS